MMYQWENRAVELKPIPTLISLAELVRERMDARRRNGPKWKFRVAPDLILQLRPLLPRKRQRGSRVIEDLLEFEGHVVEGEDVGVEAFDSREARYLTFEINPQWRLLRRSYGPYRSYPLCSGIRAP